MSDIERLEKKLDRILYLLGDGRTGDDLRREAKKVISLKPKPTLEDIIRNWIVEEIERNI